MMKRKNYVIATTKNYSLNSGYYKCKTCNYVVKPISFPRICANCETEMKVQQIFPMISDIEMLRLVLHFYKIAYKDANRSRQSLVKKINSNLNKKYTGKQIFSVQSQIILTFNNDGDSQKSLNKILEVIKKGLNLANNDEALVVFREAYVFSNVTPEHKMLVILVGSLLESLLYNFVKSVLYSQGMSPKHVSLLMKQARNFESTCNLFYEITGVKLVKAFDQVGEHTFVKNWDIVRAHRNNFIHKTPFAIDIDTCERSFDLAVIAIDAFAKLHNKFATKRLN